MTYRHVAISGELGSGKSSVAQQLSTAHLRRLVSTGDIQRGLAQRLRLSTLQTNWLAEQDPSIDEQVDQVTRELGTQTEPITFDSRMAWYMVPSAFKVHLIVHPAIAAARIYSRQSTAVEGYGSIEEALTAAEERFVSERRRFLDTYAVDIARLRNYDLVIDTSHASISDVVGAIEDAMSVQGAGLLVKVSPRRVVWGVDGQEDGRDRTPGIGYSRPLMFSLCGWRAVQTAAEAGLPLLDVTLLAEGHEEVVPGVSADRFAIEHRRSLIEEHESSH